MVIDRYQLEYLTFFQKLSCTYCGYVNGILAYWVEIAGETEKYWCGIKHKNKKDFKEPKHHKNFIDHGDSKSFYDKY